MRIDEMGMTDSQEFDFDVVDDVCVFMRNDPMFYRKSFFPAVSEMAEMMRSGKTLDKNKCLASMIENALGAYVKKYNLADMPDDVFNNDDRQKIIDQVFSEECEMIKNGEYA